MELSTWRALMTEFEEIDGVLVQACDHEFTSWSPIFDPRDNISERHCKKCGVQRYLKPMSPPKKLPEKTRRWAFLDDFKATWNK